MTEKTEAQIEREKQAVAAMANAKSNMTEALARIQTLESALKQAADDLGRMKYYVGEHAKMEIGNNYVYVKSWIADRQAAIAKALP